MSLRLVWATQFLSCSLPHPQPYPPNQRCRSSGPKILSACTHVSPRLQFIYPCQDSSHREKSPSLQMEISIIYLSIYLSILYLSISIYLFIYVCMYLSILYLSIHLSSIHPIYLSVCLSIYLSSIYIFLPLNVICSFHT